MFWQKYFSQYLRPFCFYLFHCINSVFRSVFIRVSSALHIFALLLCLMSVVEDHLNMSWRITWSWVIWPVFSSFSIFSRTTAAQKIPFWWSQTDVGPFYFLHSKVVNRLVKVSAETFFIFLAKRPERQWSYTILATIWSWVIWPAKHLELGHLARQFWSWVIWPQSWVI